MEWWKARPTWQKVALAAVVAFVAIGVLAPDADEPAAEAVDATTTTTTTVATTTTVEATTTTQVARDWYQEFVDSFGCGDTGFMECFDAENSEVGMDLAIKVMSVREITGDPSTLDVVLGDNDPEIAVWACTYIRNLIDSSDGEVPTVWVYDHTGTVLARTFLLDNHECREDS